MTFSFREPVPEFDPIHLEGASRNRFNLRNLSTHSNLALLPTRPILTHNRRLLELRNASSRSHRNPFCRGEKFRTDPRSLLRHTAPQLIGRFVSALGILVVHLSVLHLPDFDSRSF